MINLVCILVNVLGVSYTNAEFFNDLFGVKSGYFSDINYNTIKKKFIALESSNLGKNKNDLTSLD